MFDKERESKVTFIRKLIAYHSKFAQSIFENFHYYYFFFFLDNRMTYL